MKPCCALSAATSAATSARTSAAIALPSMTVRGHALPHPYPVFGAPPSAARACPAAVAPAVAHDVERLVARCGARAKAHRCSAARRASLAMSRTAASLAAPSRAAPRDLERRAAARPRSRRRPLMPSKEDFGVRRTRTVTPRIAAAAERSGFLSRAPSLIAGRRVSIRKLERCADDHALHEEQARSNTIGEKSMPPSVRQEAADGPQQRLRHGLEALQSARTNLL